MIDTVWNLVPAREPSLEGVPVRASKNVHPRNSKLYDHTTTGRPIPGSYRAPNPQNERADLQPERVFEALDKLSRTRALTNHESEALEAAMDGRVIITKREAARLGIGRTCKSTRAL